MVVAFIVHLKACEVISFVLSNVSALRKFESRFTCEFIVSIKLPIHIVQRRRYKHVMIVSRIIITKKLMQRSVHVENKQFNH